MCLVIPPVQLFYYYYFNIFKSSRKFAKLLKFTAETDKDAELYEYLK